MNRLINFHVSFSKFYTFRSYFQSLTKCWNSTEEFRPSIPWYIQIKKKKLFCCKSANGIKHFNFFDKYSVCLTSPSPKKTLHTKTRKKSQTRAREVNVAQGGCVPLSRAPTPALKSVSGTKELVTFDRWPVVNLFAATEGTASFNLCFILVPWAAEGVLLKFTAWPEVQSPSVDGLWWAKMWVPVRFSWSRPLTSIRKL